VDRRRQRAHDGGSCQCFAGVFTAGHARARRLRGDSDDNLPALPDGRRLADGDACLHDVEHQGDDLAPKPRRGSSRTNASAVGQELQPCEVKSSNKTARFPTAGVPCAAGTQAVPASQSDSELNVKMKRSTTRS